MNDVGVNVGGLTIRPKGTQGGGIRLSGLAFIVCLRDSLTVYDFSRSLRACGSATRLAIFSFVHLGFLPTFEMNFAK